MRPARSVHFTLTQYVHNAYLHNEYLLYLTYIDGILVIIFEASALKDQASIVYLILKDIVSEAVFI